MLSKFNLNKLKEQKWLYFFIGSLFTALLAGGLVYFDVYNVMGLSKLQSDPAQNLPALIADSRAEIYGGLTTNQTGNAESGLIVLGGYDDVDKKTYGKVGIGFSTSTIPTEMLEVRGNVVVVDRPDTSGKEYLFAPAARTDDLIVKNIQALPGSKIDINGELNINGNRGESTSTVHSTLLVRTGDDSYVDIGDVFEMQAIKIWIDGTNFNWAIGQVYDSNKNNITATCSGSIGSSSLKGYRVSSNQWFEVSCVNHPFPPDPDLGCLLAAAYPSSGWQRLAGGSWQWFRSLLVPMAQAAAYCDDYSWDTSSPQPSGFPKPAWTNGDLKIKAKYLP